MSVGGEMRCLSRTKRVAINHACELDDGGEEPIEKQCVCGWDAVVMG